MTLQEFYEEIHGNYAEVSSRLMNDKRIYKYLYKFKDCSDYSDLMNALAAENWEDAFRFSHNLKGMCLNLSLSALATVSSDLCEEFRNGPPKKDVSSMVADVTSEYEKVLAALAVLDPLA